MISPRSRLLIIAVGLLIMHNLNYNNLAYRGRRDHAMGADLVVERDPLTAVIGCCLCSVVQLHRHLDLWSYECPNSISTSAESTK